MTLHASRTGVAAGQRSQAPDQILWTDDENIYRPSPRPLAEFLSTIELISPPTVGAADPDFSLLLFFEQGCMEKMQAHACSEILREQAGILCGEAFSYGSARYYSTITSAIAVDTEAGAAHFRFHERSWDAVWKNMRPGANVLGWYHTHPGMGVFLSATDLRTQQLYFRSPCQIAVVMDPVMRETRVFCGSTGTEIPEGNCFRYLQKR